MSGPGDRIPVPTNGHRPSIARVTDAPPPAGAPPEGGAARPTVPAPRPARGGPTAPDLRIAVTPATAAAGFGVLAAIIVLLLGRRRRG